MSINISINEVSTPRFDHKVVIIKISSKLNLIVNDVLQSFNDVSPGIQLVQDDLELLGAPLTLSSAKKVLLNKLLTVERSLDNLKVLHSHVAYFLLRHCFWIPKLSFVIRTTPTWLYPEIISEFDVCFKRALETWKQVLG
jgi:hypothetical protein